MDQLEVKEIDTKRFHYRYYASHASEVTSKYTLLLCHGFPDGAQLWQFVIPHLKKTGLRIIAPDLLGYGGTSKPTDPEQFKWPGLVDDVKEILKNEGVEGSIIPVGHDWGSAFAQRFYMLNSAQCAGLITLNVALIPPRTDPFDVDAFNKYTEQTLGYQLYAYWKLFLPESGAKLMDERLESLWHVMHADEEDWMKKIFCRPGAMEEYLRADKREPRLKKYAQDEKFKNEWMSMIKEGGFLSPTCWYRVQAYGYQSDTEKTLNGKVEKPYLFIGSDGDAVCRTDFIQIPKQQGLCPDLTVHEVKSGHWSLYERPEEVSQIIVDWLKAKGFTE